LRGFHCEPCLPQPSRLRFAAVRLGFDHALATLFVFASAIDGVGRNTFCCVMTLLMMSVSAAPKSKRPGEPGLSHAPR
jgi:hypothetical protein